MPFAVVTLVVMLLVRRVIGDRERRAELAERERDLAAREAVVEERARIARELHDAIAHNVSMMVVQAGAERRVLDEANGVDARGARDDRADRPRRAHRDAPPRRDAAQRRGRPARAAAGPRRPADARRRRCARPACRSSCTSRASARELPGRDRAVGVPDRAGGADQRAQARRRRARDACTSATARDSLELEIVDDGAGGREPRGRAAATAWSGCASGSRSTAAASRPSRRPSGGFAVRVLLPIR